MWPIVTDPVARYVCQSVTLVSTAKMAEPIQIPFGLWAWMGPRDHVLDGSPEMLRDVALGRNLSIIGFLAFDGYNFGCIIAIDTLFDSRGGFSGSRYPMKTKPISRF